MMTVVSTNHAVLNSLLFIKDATSDSIPEIDGIGALWTISTCIAVGCVPDADGETEVVLGPSNEVGTNKKLLFDGILETPSCAVTIETVLAQTLLEMEVTSSRTHVQIWTNGHRASDVVIVGIVYA